MLDATPDMYARNLARYISDPSTIRARTVEYFGHNKAPSLERCAQMRRRIEEQNRRDIEAAESRAGGNLTKFPCQHPRTFENTIERRGHEVCSICTGRREALAAKRFRMSRGKMLWPPHYVPPSRKLSGTDFINELAVIFKLQPDQITGTFRSAHVVDARAIFARLMVHRGLSRTQIGRMLGGRDHSTICNLVDTWEKRCAANPELETIFARLAG